MSLVRKLVRKIPIIIALFSFYLICGTNSYVKAATSSEIEIRKCAYNEVTNELEVNAYIKGGVTLKQLTLSIGYDSSKLEWIPYDNRDIFVYDNSGFEDVNSFCDGGGVIDLETEELSDCITKTIDSPLCSIKFKLLGDPTSEEDIPDGLFWTERVEIKNDTELYEGNANIKQMRKLIGSIEVTNTIFSKDIYKHGEQIELVSGTAIIKYTNYANASGAKREVDLETLQDTNGNSINITRTGSWIADYYNPHVQLMYKSVTSEQIPVTVIDWIKEISLENPTKIKYAYGENLDTTNGKILITYATGRTDTVNVTEAMVKEQNDNPFDSTILGTRNLKVTYNYTEDGILKSQTKNYEIEVYDYIEDIKIITPTKTEYEYGESDLDLSNGQVVIRMASKNIIKKDLSELPLYNPSMKSSRSVVEDEQLQIEGFNSDSPGGPQEITLTYWYTEGGVRKSVTAKYTINIKPGIKDIQLNENTLTMLYGKAITRTELLPYEVIITKTDESIENVPVTISMTDISEYNPTNLAEQTIYVNYTYRQGGETETVQLPIFVIVENYLDHIILSHDNITVDYGSTLGEDTLTAEYRIIPIMANNEYGTATRLTKDKIVGVYNTEQEGVYAVKVKYEDKYANFTIVVVDPIIKIKLEDEEKAKIKMEYKYKEELNLNGAQLTIVKLSGETKIDLTKDMIKNYNSEEIGKQTLDIEYSRKEIKQAIDVEVKDYIIDIILVKPDKLSYLPGETLDLTGATVQTLSASGKLEEPQAVTMDMITGYKENEMGTQRLIVNYEGFQKSFDIIFTVQTGTRIY